MAASNILLSGFGGQGILFAGKVAAYAGLIDGKEVSWLPSYGPEMRGGAANCSICLNDEEIACPLILHPDILAVMNLPSYDKYIDEAKAGAIVVVDSFLVDKRTDRTDIKVFYLPATQMAVENKLEKLANMIILGKLAKESGFATEESLFKALTKVIPAKRQHLVEFNKQALILGMNS